MLWIAGETHPSSKQWIWVAELYRLLSKCFGTAWQAVAMFVEGKNIPSKPLYNRLDFILPTHAHVENELQANFLKKNPT